MSFALSCYVIAAHLEIGLNMLISPWCGGAQQPFRYYPIQPILSHHVSEWESKRLEQVTSTRLDRRSRYEPEIYQSIKQSTWKLLQQMASNIGGGTVLNFPSSVIICNNVIYYRQLIEDAHVFTIFWLVKSQDGLLKKKCGDRDKLFKDDRIEKYCLQTHPLRVHGAGDKWWYGAKHNHFNDAISSG